MTSQQRPYGDFVGSELFVSLFSHFEYDQKRGGKVLFDKLFRYARENGLLPPISTIIDFGCGDASNLKSLLDRWEERYQKDKAAHSPERLSEVPGRIIVLDSCPKMLGKARGLLGKLVRNQDVLPVSESSAVDDAIRGLERLPVDWSSAALLCLGHTWFHLQPPNALLALIAKFRPAVVVVDVFATWDETIAALEANPEGFRDEELRLVDGKYYCLRSQSAENGLVRRGVFCHTTGEWIYDTLQTATTSRAFYGTPLVGGDQLPASSTPQRACDALALAREGGALVGEHDYLSVRRISHPSGWGPMESHAFLARHDVGRQVNELYFQSVNLLVEEVLCADENGSRASSERSLREHLRLFPRSEVGVLLPFDPNRTYARFRPRIPFAATHPCGNDCARPKKSSPCDPIDLVLELPNRYQQRFPTAYGLFQTMLGPVSSPVALRLSEAPDYEVSDADRLFDIIEKSYFSRTGEFWSALGRPIANDGSNPSPSPPDGRARSAPSPSSSPPGKVGRSDTDAVAWDTSSDGDPRPLDKPDDATATDDVDRDAPVLMVPFYFGSLPLFALALEQPTVFPLDSTQSQVYFSLVQNLDRHLRSIITIERLTESVLRPFLSQLVRKAGVGSTPDPDNGALWRHVQQALLGSDPHADAWLLFRRPWQSWISALPGRRLVSMSGAVEAENRQLQTAVRREWIRAKSNVQEGLASLLQDVQFFTEEAHDSLIHSKHDLALAQLRQKVRPLADDAFDPEGLAAAALGAGAARSPFVRAFCDALNSFWTCGRPGDSMRRCHSCDQRFLIFKEAFCRAHANHIEQFRFSFARLFVLSHIALGLEPDFIAFQRWQAVDVKARNLVPSYPTRITCRSDRTWPLVSVLADWRAFRPEPPASLTISEPPAIPTLGNPATTSVSMTLTGAGLCSLGGGQDTYSRIVRPLEEAVTRVGYLADDRTNPSNLSFVFRVFANRGSMDLSFEGHWQ